MKKAIQAAIEEILRYLLGIFNTLFSATRIEAINIAGRRAKFRAQGGKIGAGSFFYSHVIVKHPENVFIGQRTTISDFCHIWGGGGINIGDEVMIASHCAITSETHCTSAAIFRQSHIQRPIIIGNNVWIGTGTTILPGVTIGSNVIIGAHSLVNQSIPSNSVAYGSPARLVRKIEEHNTGREER